MFSHGAASTYPVRYADFSGASSAGLDTGDEMATWQNLRQYIAETYKYTELDNGQLKLVFDMGNDRSQVVILSVHRLGDGTEEWVMIESPIGPLDRVDVHRALREAGQMVCGALALDMMDVGLVVYRHTLPLANLDINEFERPLELVLSTGDRLEQMLTGVDEF